MRLWCARTGVLLRRFGFGGSVAAMALCRATGLSLLLGDSTGQLYLFPNLDLAPPHATAAAAAALSALVLLAAPARPRARAHRLPQPSRLAEAACLARRL